MSPPWAPHALLLAVFVIGVCNANAGVAPPYTELFMDQPVDHFSTDARTYRMRYLVNNLSWTPGAENAPIFFYTGNEGPITDFWELSGLVHEMAPSFNALVLFGEHRYYGESWPFGTADASHLPNNIQYLSVEQALADFASLVEHVRRQFSAPRAPVIAFGGSYGGMLSAWFRVKYPWLCDGALAASAPINMAASDPPVGVPPFFTTVTADFAAADARCPDSVRAEFAAIAHLAAQGVAGAVTLQQRLNLCTVPSDFSLLNLWLRNAFVTVTQGDYPYAANGLPAWPAAASCSALLEAIATTGPVTGLAEVVKIAYGDLKCHDVASEFQECADQSGCGGDRSWDYQCCTEVVYYPSTNNVSDMFPPYVWNAQTLSSYCNTTWNLPHSRQGWLKTYVGGASIIEKGTSKIIFSNGLLDPWHGGGFLNAPGNLENELPVLLVPTGAHHLDLRFSNPADPPAVVAVRQQEHAWIAKWVADAQHSAAATGATAVTAANPEDAPSFSFNMAR